MRTNVVIDDALLQEAMRLTGARTKKEAIARALEELVATRRRLNLLDLAGRIRFHENYDYKKLRKGR